MAGRFLELTLKDPYSNLAAEEALFRLARAPTLRTWDNQRSVIIGRAQLARVETDVDYCAEKGIPIVRRFTAGGAVYNGPGNLNWSFFAPSGSQDTGRVRYSSDARHIFEAFAMIVVEGLVSCSVPARFVAPNRIEDGLGRKISGMAAYISKGAVICHGTLLLDVDLEEAARVTTPAGTVVDRRYPRSNFREIANVGADRGEFVSSLCSAAGIERSSDAMTVEEEELAQMLRAKYQRSEWNLGDPFSLDEP